MFSNENHQTKSLNKQTKIPLLLSHKNMKSSRAFKTEISFIDFNPCCLFMEIPIRQSFFQSKYQIIISNIKTMLSSFSMTFMVILAITTLITIDAFAVRSLSHDLSLRLHTQIFGNKVTGYVPSGMTPEEYALIKKKDAEKIKGKHLGQLGPHGFISRSIKGWQEAHERGEADHQFPVLGFKDKLKSGVIKKEDVPYMMRGGSWDNSDVKDAKKKNHPKLSKADRDYANGGYKKEQSASILGYGPGFDWTGKGVKDDKDNKGSRPGFS